VAFVKIFLAAALCALLVVPAAASAATPRPKTAKSVVVERASGKVLVKKRGSSRSTRLGSTPQSIPMGSTVDATKGTVELTSTHDKAGRRLQSAVFFDGAFVVNQTKSSKPLTDLQLAGGNFSGCAAERRRTGVFASRTTRRRLWGKGKGRFRTRGRNGSATVRGTTWLTEDGCEDTEARVRNGHVQAKPNEGATYDLEKPNESVVFTCNTDGVPGVSTLYCLVVLTRPETGVHGFGIATSGTPQNDYELCMHRPDGTLKCETYPFDTSDPAFKSSGVGCFPAQTGTYVAEWRIGGQVLPGALPFDAVASATPLCVGVPERPGDDPNNPPPGPTGKPLRQARAAASAGG
jgi:hypothetical protein